MSNELNITAIVVEACQNPSAIPSILSDAGSYGYIPTQWVGILFIVLFSLSTALHIGQAGFYRLWFLFPTAVLCGLLETAGWTARYWSGVNDVNCANPAQSSIHIVDNSFLIQIVTTIIAPTPLLGAMFILFGRVIALLGSRYSRLGPKLYSAIFLTCDIIALIVQGAGGGIAASADVGDRDTTKLGGNIMLGGIIFQLVAIVVYSTLATEFLVRYVRDAPIRRVGIHEPRAKTTRRMKLQLLALAIMTICIFIRSIYRTIELADGWNGEIITTEWLFAVWDGLMITFAMFTLNILHPGMLLPRGSAISTGQSSSTLAMGMGSLKA